MILRTGCARSGSTKWNSAIGTVNFINYVCLRTILSRWTYCTRLLSWSRIWSCRTGNIVIISSICTGASISSRTICTLKSCWTDILASQAPYNIFSFCIKASISYWTNGARSLPFVWISSGQTSCHILIRLWAWIARWTQFTQAFTCKRVGTFLALDNTIKALWCAVISSWASLQAVNGIEIAYIANLVEDICELSTSTSCNSIIFADITIRTLFTLGLTYLILIGS
jgi:hypothetical protein